MVAATPLFRHTKILHTLSLVEMGSAAFVAAAAFSRQGDPYLLQGKIKKRKRKEKSLS